MLEANSAILPKDIRELKAFIFRTFNNLYNLEEPTDPNIVNYLRKNYPQASEDATNFAVALRSAGFNIRDAEWDGNCFFQVIAETLNQQNANNNHNPTNLREIAANYIEININDFVPFLLDREGNPIEAETYLQNLRQDGHAADEAAIRALAQTLDINIYIYTRMAHQPTLIEGGSSETINIGFTGGHYVFLTPIAAPQEDDFEADATAHMEISSDLDENDQETTEQDYAALDSSSSSLLNQAFIETSLSNIDIYSIAQDNSILISTPILDSLNSVRANLANIFYRQSASNPEQTQQEDLLEVRENLSDRFHNQDADGLYNSNHEVSGLTVIASIAVLGYFMFYENAIGYSG